MKRTQWGLAVVGSLLIALASCPNDSAAAEKPKKGPVLQETAKSVGNVQIGEKTFELIEFGVFPQSVKEAKTAFAKDSKGKFMETVKGGLHCRLGADGFYYTKHKATPYNNDESIHFGENGEGDPVKKGTDYWFKLEPIRWRVLDAAYTDSHGIEKGKLLMATKALTCMAFDKENKNKYCDSDLNKYLINDFKEIAFTVKALESVVDISLKNDQASTFGIGEDQHENQQTCDPFNAIAFALSASELTKDDYGFSDALAYGEKDSRLQKTTDYAKALGTNFNSNGASIYWTRSPHYNDAKSVRIVSQQGGLQILGRPAIYEANKSQVAVVPACVLMSAE